MYCNYLLLFLGIIFYQYLLHFYPDDYITLTLGGISVTYQVMSLIIFSINNFYKEND